MWVLNMHTFIVYNSDRCTGCRTCQLACSFHFFQVFSKEVSAIEIKRKHEEEFKMIVHKEDSGSRKGCDLCKGELEPLCVKYCMTEAIQVGEAI